MMNKMEFLKNFGEAQMLKQGNGDYENLIEIEQDIDKDVSVVNPFLNETGRFHVVPEIYYGSKNFKKWKKEVMNEYHITKIRNGKYRTRRNTAITLSFLTLSILSIIIGIKIGESKEKNIIENDNVKIQYFQIDEDDFDIIIESKGSFNISPEWSMKGESWYKDAYLTGKTNKKAYEFYKKNLKDDFDFNWNQ